MVNQMRFLSILLIALLLAGPLLFAQDSGNTGRRKFYNVEELIRLIEQAREAGMSEEDLQNMEIIDGDQEINVMEYIEKKRLARLLKNQRLKELLSKNFLTVNDIYKELIKTEPSVIQKLREELVSER
jgi:hypothetical protein